MKAPRPKPPVQEPVTLTHSFSKSCHYENMKGAYEVVSIDGGTMRIRWENGDETDTDVKLQDRILCRIERELRAAKAERRGGSEPTEYGYGERFRGLSATDFTLDVPKTTWRSRTGGLGGAVTQELTDPELCFGFWVPFGRPMIHWADVDQRGRNPVKLRAGFFCRLDQVRAYYGFFVERSPEADGKGDWHRLLDWLSAQEHEQWLRSSAEESELRIFDPQEVPSFTGYLEASGATWVWVDGQRRTNVPSLSAFLAALPEDPPAALECAALLPKERAVGRMTKLPRDISQLLGQLMPLYRASMGAEERRQAVPSRKRAAH